MGAFLNIVMRRSALLVFVLSIFWSTALFGQRVIYVNGVMNTESDAEDSRLRIDEILYTSVNHPNNKRTFAVTKKWNPIGYTGIAGGFSWSIFNSWSDGFLPLGQDKRELFMLKTAEEMYEDDFGQMLGIWGPGKTPIIISGTPNINTLAAARVATYADNMSNVDVSIKWSTSSPDTDIGVGPNSMDATQGVVNSIVNDIILNGPAIVVAHSEGNLLANLAYAKLAAQYGNDVRRLMVIVNLANTAKFSTNGLNLTHAGDGILFKDADIIYGGLENMPVSEGWYRTTPRSVWDYPALPPVAFEVMPATFETIQPSASLKADHGILEAYLSDRAVEPTQNTASVFTFTPLANRFRDRFEDLVYAAAASLDAAALLPVVQMLNPCVIAGEGQSVTLSATAMSQVGNLSEVHWERLDHPEVNFSLPAYANTTMSGNSAASSVTFTTPFVAAITTFKIGFFARDDRGMLSSGVAQVQVQHGNIAPTITADASYTAITGTTVTLHASALDLDGTLASASIEQLDNLSWLLISSPQTLITYGGASGSWDIPVSIAGNVPGGIYTFGITVIDNNGALVTRNINLEITPNYFVDDFATVSSVIGSHWAVNSFGSSAFVSGSELNLQHLVAQSMSLGTRAFHEGTNFRAYAKLSDGGSVRLTAGMDGMAIVQNLSTAPHRYQAQTWVTDPNTYETQTQYTDLDITPDTYHLFEYIYGLDGMITLLVDQVALKQMLTTPAFFYGARMQFSYGQTLNGTGTLVQWAGVTP